VCQLVLPAEKSPFAIRLSPVPEPPAPVAPPLPPVPVAPAVPVFPLPPVPPPPVSAGAQPSVSRLNDQIATL